MVDKFSPAASTDRTTSDETAHDSHSVFSHHMVVYLLASGLYELIYVMHVTKMYSY
jgi:hypothetical protein